MEKELTPILKETHQIQLLDRKNIKLTGVTKIENFDKTEFFVQSVLGYILIKGADLQLLKLDTMEGLLTIKGQINSINYIEQGKKKEKVESVISKLFK